MWGSGAKEEGEEEGQPARAKNPEQTLRCTSALSPSFHTDTFPVTQQS